jgi:cytochrome c556
MGTRNQAMKLVIGAVLSAGCLLVGVATANQQAVETRQHNLKELGGAFKAVRDELRNSKPNMTLLVQETTKMEQLIGKMNGWFPKDSAPGAGIETDAKPEIWADPQGFTAVMTKAQAEVPKLATFAKANDLDGLKKQVAAAGAACKGCHDKYRVPQD